VSNAIQSSPLFDSNSIYYVLGSKSDSPIASKVVYDISGNIVGENSQTASQVSGQVAARDMQFYSDLTSNKWIVNPYKSDYYDDLCPPAVLYRMQKEKQIGCIYLRCLENQYSAGLPITSCTEQNDLYTCIYIDSAQASLGGKTSQFIAGLLKSATQYAISMGVMYAYNSACASYLKGLHNSDALETPGTLTAVSCGLIGAGLQWKDIQTVLSPSAWKNFFGSERPGDPAQIHDYCQGVDYRG
jgi:hypothetical protein